MNIEDYYDYRDLYPGGDAHNFWVESYLLIIKIENISKIMASIEKRRVRPDYAQGMSSRINRQIDQLRALLDKLDPETVAHLVKLEEEFLVEGRFVPEYSKTAQPTDSELNRQRGMILLGFDNSLRRLRMLVEERFRGRREDRRYPALAHGAQEIWERYGGRVTETEGERTFLAYLEALIEDLKLSVSPRTLIQKYLR